MIGIAVVGTGYWGKNHVRNYKTLLLEKEIDYLKICDIDENRASQMAEDYNLECTSDLDDIINDDRIIPSDKHYL